MIKFSSNVDYQHTGPSVEIAGTSRQFAKNAMSLDNLLAYTMLGYLAQKTDKFDVALNALGERKNEVVERIRQKFAISDGYVRVLPIAMTRRINVDVAENVGVALTAHESDMVCYIAEWGDTTGEETNAMTIAVAKTYLPKL